MLLKVRRKSLRVEARISSVSYSRGCSWSAQHGQSPEHRTSLRLSEGEHTRPVKNISYC